MWYVGSVWAAAALVANLKMTMNGGSWMELLLLAHLMWWQEGYTSLNRFQGGCLVVTCSNGLLSSMWSQRFSYLERGWFPLCAMNAVIK
jgi:hypothetical protein